MLLKIPLDYALNTKLQQKDTAQEDFLNSLL